MVRPAGQPTLAFWEPSEVTLVFEHVVGCACEEKAAETRQADAPLAIDLRCIERYVTFLPEAWS